MHAGLGLQHADHAEQVLGPWDCLTDRTSASGSFAACQVTRSISRIRSSRRCLDAIAQSRALIGGFRFSEIFLTPPQITCIIPAVPCLKEGRFMTVAKRGAGCGGRGSAVMRFGAWANGAQALRSLGGEGRLRTAKSRGPDARNAGVKSAELSAGDGVKKLRFTRESAIYAVEPLRGEGRSVSAEPVCSCAFPFDAHCTRDRGCGAHPVFPAPSLEGSRAPSV